MHHQRIEPTALAAKTSRAHLRQAQRELRPVAAREAIALIARVFAATPKLVRLRVTIECAWGTSEQGAPQRQRRLFANATFERATRNGDLLTRAFGEEIPVARCASAQDAELDFGGLLEDSHVGAELCEILDLGQCDASLDVSAVMLHASSIEDLAAMVKFD